MFKLVVFLLLGAIVNVAVAALSVNHAATSWPTVCRACTAPVPLRSGVFLHSEVLANALLPSILDKAFKGEL